MLTSQWSWAAAPGRDVQRTVPSGRPPAARIQAPQVWRKTWKLTPSGIVTPLASSARAEQLVRRARLREAERRADAARKLVGLVRPRRVARPHQREAHGLGSDRREVQPLRLAVPRVGEVDEAVVEVDVRDLDRQRLAKPASRVEEECAERGEALRMIFPHEGSLVLFSVGAVTEGTDAQARTTVRLAEGGKMVDGQGADTDTIVSAARAYVHALNKLLVKRVRTEPEALSA